MFGRLSLAVCLLISSVSAATVPSGHSYPSTLRHELHCGPRCVDIIPLNPRVKCFDAYKDGSLIKQYRDELKKKCIEYRKGLLFRDYKEDILNFGVCGISLELYQYKCAVYDTIRCLVGKPEYKGSDELNQILCHIYNAANNKSGASDQDLLIFTAIAMHNHHYLTKFPSKDNNTSFDCVCRGLLQIKSKVYYEKLKDISSTYNYISEPWKLNCFDAVSISDEFTLYWNEFRPCKSTDNITAMCYSIKAMGSAESELLSNINGCFDFLKISDKTLKDKLRRRYTIMCKLSSYMSLYESFSAATIQ